VAAAASLKKRFDFNKSVLGAWALGPLGSVKIITRMGLPLREMLVYLFARLGGAQSRRGDEKIVDRGRGGRLPSPFYENLFQQRRVRLRFNGEKRKIDEGETKEEGPTHKAKRLKGVVSKI
jgi:hypothetical protein